MVSKHLVFSKKHAEFHSIILQVVKNLWSLGFCFCKRTLVKWSNIYRCWIQLWVQSKDYIITENIMICYCCNCHLLEIVFKFIELVVTNCNLKACFKILIYFCLRRNLEEVKQEVESCNNTSSNWFACYSHISVR